MIRPPPQSTRTDQRFPDTARVRSLARARAIENTAYVVAVGQAAPRYTGHSLVVDPFGDVVVETQGDPTVLMATLERDVIDKARSTNPSLANRRRADR